MKKLPCLFLFIMAVAGFKYAYCQDNLLAVDVVIDKQKTSAPIEAAKTVDDFEQELKKIKSYREVLENKQKEIELIKLDLAKSEIMLKKRRAEKEIYEIDKSLPQGRAETPSIPGGFNQGTKESLADISDIKIQLLVIADNLREGQVSLKGIPYSFKEGDSVVSKLTAQEIGPSGVTFKQPDGSVLKLNFTN